MALLFVCKSYIRCQDEFRSPSATKVHFFGKPENLDWYVHEFDDSSMNAGTQCNCN